MHSNDCFERKVVCLPADISLPTLGLGQSTLDDIRAHASLFIHSAWNVNFTLPVRSFELQHIAGLYNLLRLSLGSCLPSPPQFLFCSSISAVSGTTPPAYIPELHVDDFGCSQSTGYGRSKLVAEHIVRAAARSGANARALRLGQIVGDSKQGLWNDSEAVPLMIRSALTLRTLPDLADEPGLSWLPVDTVARVVLELSGLFQSSASPSPKERLSGDLGAASPDLVYNILNNKRLSWSRDVLPELRSAGLEFETVPTKEWLRHLRDSNRDPLENPATKLLHFWEKKFAIDMADDTAYESGIGEENGYERPGAQAGGLENDCPELTFEMKTLMDDSVIMREGKFKAEIAKFAAQWLKAWN